MHGLLKESLSLDQYPKQQNGRIWIQKKVAKDTSQGCQAYGSRAGYQRKQLVQTKREKQKKYQMKQFSGRNKSRQRL